MHTTSSKALLLDVDGVMMRHPRVLHRVAHQVTRYIQTKTPKVHNTLEATELNKMLYSTFGHTHIGLRELYGTRAPSRNDFNKFVYDKDVLNYLAIHDNTEQIKESADQVRMLLDYAISSNIPCYVFSNAPDAWCNIVLEMLLVSTMIPKSNRFTCDHDVFEDRLFKPDTKLYKNVATFVQQTHHDRDMQMVFVDDSLSNLIPVLNSPVWKPVYLNESECTLTSEKITHAKRLGDIIHML